MLSKAATFPRPHGTEFSPIGLYYMDNTVGVTVDSSGNSRTLTTTTAGTPAASSMTGYSALSGGKYTRVDSTFLLTGAVSAAVLARVPASGTFWIVGYGGTTTGTSPLNVAWALRTINGQLNYFHEVGSGTDVSSTFTDIDIPTGGWAHLAFTRSSGGTVKAFVNGVANASASVNMTNIDSSNVNNILSIGQSSASANAFTGEYHNIAIYNTELTEAQILYLAKRSLRRRL